MQEGVQSWLLLCGKSRGEGHCLMVMIVHLLAFCLFFVCWLACFPTSHTLAGASHHPRSNCSPAWGGLPMPNATPYRDTHLRF